MRFAVLGSGAVGGYYGARLARAGDDVAFLARGAHLEAIRASGLSVASPLGDFTIRAPAESDPGRIGPVDVVLYAVKTYDDGGALPLLAPLLGPDTIVLTLQNGVESPETVAAAVGRAHVVGGTTYIATALEAPGRIRQTGTYRRIVIGECFERAGQVTPRVLMLRDVLAAADIQAEASSDGRVPIWEKFIYLAPLAGFTAAARLPAGAIWSDIGLREQFLEGVREVERLARAEGVPVARDIERRVHTYMAGVSPDMRTSMLIDLSAGKRIEVEALQGAVVRRARTVNVPVPVMATLYTLLGPYRDGVPAL
jgi:2-dehydropantoate 2-reductase